MQRPFCHEDVSHVTREIVESLPMHPIIAAVYLTYFQQSRVENVNFVPLTANNVRLYDSRYGQITLKRERFIEQLMIRAFEILRRIGFPKNIESSSIFREMDEFVVSRHAYLSHAFSKF